MILVVADLHDRGYFRGWYFKCCTGEETIAFIPAYHSYNGVKTASLQIITDDATIQLPFEQLEYRENPLAVRIGDCSFTESDILLNYQDSRIRLEGTIRFQAFSPIAYDIMGPFSLVPFMQCRHSVYSMAHRIDGKILAGDRLFDFANGIGYLEGDRGRSFPKRYIWTQCCFENGSLMLSVADIPLLGLHFTGIIGVILLDGKEYRIATYLGAGISRIGEAEVTVRQGGYTFTAERLERNTQPLLAPANGSMCRTIHESASCKAYYRFTYQGKALCEFVSSNASFEFEYPLE